MITLEQFIADRQQELESATGAFSKILRDISLGAKLVSFYLRRASLAGFLGEIGITNVQGESVQKLDDMANRLFINLFSKNPHIAGIASEEEEHIIPTHPEGRYVILLDPLDGSSNIDVGVPVGTIFSIYRRVSSIGEPCTEADFLQGGRHQVAAGYVLYGTSTLLFYTTGRGVHGFTLEPAAGEFLLTYPQVQMPTKSSYYSFNDNQLHEWSEGLQRYVTDLHARNRSSDKPQSLRYVGSLVADFHRNLLKGGLFMYPGTVKKPEGKLRLLYEGFPMAWLTEQAGGKASDGYQTLLDVPAKKIHQRTPLFLGPATEIDRITEFLRNHVSVEAV
ncbi:MAG: class 1 fructose-bisphosphatase [Bacteroidia bacterium]|nr:class 1 fructose-bisphosphatase [Bacteroidia bacterium]MCX7651381.1 class 1 fructose-bisphosphatase [Bacteroidia bacterium]MDW8416719.1 class 1 fructose-bisphosphatase [Bacteroidia bacterium]